jgi:peroxiredoxin Q/BCP
MSLFKHIFGALFRRGRRPMLASGDTAPDFDLLDHLGRRVRLSDLRGRRVVLWFYPKADTPG